jgi:hypothetical protein
MQISPMLEALKTYLRQPLTMLVWLALIACLSSIARDASGQWDFQVFYSAIHTLAAGGDPYAPIHAAPQQQGSLAFLYPPLALQLFRWTSAFSPYAAKLIWLGVKLVALALLLRLWHKEFERLDAGWRIVLLISLGFNAALLRDFSSGNVSTVEQLGIWFGLSLLLRGRLYTAAVVFACIAQLKLLPIAFIALIPLLQPRDGWKPFLVGCIAFAGLLCLNPIVSPTLTHEYLALLAGSNPSFDERGDINPSSLALFRDVVHLTPHLSGFIAERALGTWAYCVYLLILAGGIMLVLTASSRHAADSDPKADRKLLLYFGCAIFAVAMPRMKDYTYILMLMPSLFVLRDMRRRGGSVDYLLVALCLMIGAQPQQSYVPRLKSLIYLCQGYLPLFMAAGVMVYIANALGRSTNEVDTKASEDLSREQHRLYAARSARDERTEHAPGVAS